MNMYFKYPAETSQKTFSDVLIDDVVEVKEFDYIISDECPSGFHDTVEKAIAKVETSQKTKRVK